MKKYIYLPLTLILSVLFHLYVLIILPDFNIEMEKESQNIEIELVKPKTTKKTANSGNKKEKQQKKPKPEKKQLISAKKALADTNVQVSSTLPEVDLPEYEEEPEISTPPPGYEKLVAASESKTDGAEGLLSEIESARAEADRSSGGNEGTGTTSNFFEIQNTSNQNRKLLKPYPKKPEFSLESNTTIKLKFNVNKSGTTYSITPLTRSDTRIEQMAKNYVKKLNFEAVSYSKPDEIQIKLYFKVQ